MRKKNNSVILDQNWP